MKICLKCGNHFPLRTIINGERKSLQRRKYCLECSPYKKHNTSQIHKIKKSLGHCRACDEDFYLKNGQRSQHICAKCCMRIRRIKLKRKLILAKGGRCQKCGYDKIIFLGSFCFHHLNPSEKENGIIGYTTSWKKASAEADKCQLLCIRCHAEIHHDIHMNNNNKTYHNILSEAILNNDS